MITYELYWRDPIEGYQLIAVLPERRKKIGRITQESVIHWGKEYFGRNSNSKDMFFIQVTVDKDMNRIFRPNPVFITQKKN